MAHHHKNRREFIKQAGCAALGSTTLFSTLLNLKALGAASIFDSTVAGGDDYKAIVDHGAAVVGVGGGHDQVPVAGLGEIRIADGSALPGTNVDRATTFADSKNSTISAIPYKQKVCTVTIII